MDKKEEAYERMTMKTPTMQQIRTSRLDPSLQRQKEPGPNPVQIWLDDLQRLAVAVADGEGENAWWG